METKYWQDRAVSALGKTDGMKTQAVKDLRRVVAGWVFTEAGMVDSGQGYPNPRIVSAIRGLESFAGDDLVSAIRSLD